MIENQSQTPDEFMTWLQEDLKQYGGMLSDEALEAIRTRIGASEEQNEVVLPSASNITGRFDSLLDDDTEDGRAEQIASNDSEIRDGVRVLGGLGTDFDINEDGDEDIGPRCEFCGKGLIEFDTFAYVPYCSAECRDEAQTLVEEGEMTHYEADE